jgi:predicted RecA/RadA family phage recombinase
MAYAPSQLVGADFTKVDTVQAFTLGAITRGTDPTLGAGEFIYLKGIASTVVGSLVSYDAAHQTALCPVGNNVPRNVAVAMAAIVASSFGWYQISGLATVSKTSGISIAAGAAVGVKTIGKVASTGTSKELLGATAATFASAGTTATVYINRPKQQGRIS